LPIDDLHLGNVVGLDIHQKQVTVCALVVGPDGHNASPEFREYNTFRKDLHEMAEWIASLDPDDVVMESTGVYWRSPYRILYQHGAIPTVVNAWHIKNVPGRKTDNQDSLWLAQIARADLVNPSFVSSPEFEDLRAIARQRQKYVGMLASEKNRLAKNLADIGFRLGAVVSDLHGQSARRMTECLIRGGTSEEALSLAGNRLRASRQELLLALDGNLSEKRRFLLSEIEESILGLEKKIFRLEEFLFECLRPYNKALDLLETIPGLDRTAAAILLVEIGPDMEVFGSPERLASWAGLCPGNNESAGKRKSGKTKKGNRYVRRILCEASQAAVRTNCMLQTKFKSLFITRGYKRAVVAVAHKILRIAFALLKKEVPYKDQTVNYEELMVKRNHSRWIRALQKYNYLHGSEQEEGPAAPKEPVEPKGPAAPKEPVEPKGPAAPKKPGRPKGPAAPKEPVEPKGPPAPK
jgi:transposase